MKHMQEMMDKIDQAIESGENAILDLIGKLDTRGHYILRAKLTREKKMTSEIAEMLQQEGV